MIDHREDLEPKIYLKYYCYSQEIEISIIDYHVYFSFLKRRQKVINKLIVTLLEWLMYIFHQQVSLSQTVTILQ